MTTVSPFSAPRSSTTIDLAFCPRSRSTTWSTSSSDTSAFAFITEIPLYSPSATSGLTATSAVKINGLPCSSCTMSITGRDTTDKPLSSAAGIQFSWISWFAASSKKISGPYIFSIIFRGTFPFRKPGSRIFPFCFKYACCIASSTLSSDTSIVSFAILCSNFSTCRLINSCFLLIYKCIRLCRYIFCCR